MLVDFRICTQQKTIHTLLKIIYKHYISHYICWPSYKNVLNVLIGLLKALPPNNTHSPSLKLITFDSPPLDGHHKKIDSQMTIPSLNAY